MKSLAIVAVMSIGTILLRGLPFVIFRKHTPSYIVYLGRVLPPALIGMLVIYCFKDVSFTTAPHGLPELIAAGSVVLLHVWKRSSLVSILGGTAIYMVLVQMIFA
jgi:branched-subunit amino acid transport protein AzlD